MTIAVDVQEAKTRLSELLAQVEAGAQAILESLPLVTRDPVLSGLNGVRVLW